MPDAADKNNCPGLAAALRPADLLVLSVRRCTPTADRLDAVRAYLVAGTPLVGIRTACHAFALRPADPPLTATQSAWQDFDPEVLGGHYTHHHGAGPPTVVTLAQGRAPRHSRRYCAGAADRRGFAVSSEPVVGRHDTPAVGCDTRPTARAGGLDKHLWHEARADFYTSLGHPDDFRNAEFRRPLRNGMAWAMRRD